VSIYLHANQSRKRFVFHEEESLVFCPVIYLLALAFADDAFEANFTTPGEIYNLVIPNGSDRLRLRWKKPWEERPIFRDVEDTASGVRISETKPLQYPKHRHHFVRLGRTCGFEKALEFYDLRRASGKNLNGKAATNSNGPGLDC
jgi:hypothetical protein